MGLVTTGKVRFSYANVFTPKSINGSDPKYSVSLIIPKSDTATVAKIRKAIKDATAEGKSSKWGGKVPGNLKTPLRDGDLERPDDEAYAGSWFMNANANRAPGVVDRNREPILNGDDFYSGCYGHASVSIYPYNSGGSKGVACGLNHLMKAADGERLSGGVSVEDAFSGLDDFEDEDEL